MAARRSAATAPRRSRLSGTPPQINAALAGLSYTGNLNFNGADTLTVTTGDGTAQDIDTVAITVNPVNDAPVNTVPGAQIVNEDTALPIAGVSVADVDGTPLTTTLTVTQRHAQRDDGWRRDDRRQRQRRGHAFGARATQINAALAGLTYTGNLNFNGPDTLTVTTGDGTAQDIDTVAITVNPVNDAPVNTVPGAQSVNEDTALPIAGVSVADVDGTRADHHADGDQRHAQRDDGRRRNDRRQRHRHGHAFGKRRRRSTRRSPASPTPAISTSTAPTRSRSPPATAPRRTSTRSPSPSTR